MARSVVNPREGALFNIEQAKETDERPAILRTQPHNQAAPAAGRRTALDYRKGPSTARLRAARRWRGCPRHCATHVNTARCVSATMRRRVREIVEWSGGTSCRATPGIPQCQRIGRAPGDPALG